VCKARAFIQAARPLAALVILASALLARADANVAVRYREGLTHGFLVLTTMDGTPIAEGDLTEVAHGNQVTTRLTYHFKDGSLQDETTVFSQRKAFSLTSYHLVQKGPSFKHPSDLTVTASTGQVSVHYTDDKGKEQSVDEHMKLPSDLANGLVLTMLKNLGPNDKLPELSMVVAAPKPRIVKLKIGYEGKQPFSLAGSNREAMHYTIKIEIGGLEGWLAPLVGKQPPDSHVWILGGDAPTFVKSETLSYFGGPMWRTELLSPAWPRTSDEPKNASTKQ
jgi:hypothetical protein